MKKLILSLDPATYYTGYCLFAFDVEEHHNNKLLDFGRIVSKLSNMEKRVAEIGLKIEKYINSIFEKYKYLQFEFEVISEHYPYHTPNVACTSALAFLAGYIVSICDFKKIKMSFYLSTEWKKTLFEIAHSKMKIKKDGQYSKISISSTREEQKKMALELFNKMENLNIKEDDVADAYFIFLHHKKIFLNWKGGEQHGR